MKKNNNLLLSKTKYLDGLKCLKLLWYEYNRKGEIPELDANTKAIMEQGKAVGKLAHTRFPEGIILEREYIPDKHSKNSLAALKLQKPLFEAGFVFEHSYALADILDPVGNSKWDLIEVKSSTRVKDEHYYDVAFQKYTYKGAGLHIRKCFIMHINSQYKRKGDIDPEKLFKKQDVTEEADKIIPTINERIISMIEIIQEGGIPSVKIGEHCISPYQCPLRDICWNFLPEKGNILCLHSPKEKAYEQLERGVLKISEIPDSEPLTDKQKIQVASHRSGEPHIDKEGIKKFLDGLEYPMYFLDFETISPVIPIYDNSRPFERIPFQYSVYVVKNEGMKPEHHSYLAPGDKDPRYEILKQLKELLGTSGSIIAYNATFEKTVLRQASEVYSEYQGWVKSIEKRIVDLLAPFRTFLFYHPDQEGSSSLKKVLPVLTESNYDNMEISDGEMASLEYFRVTFSEETDEKERQRIRKALEKYCDLDTKGMIDILKELEKMSNESVASHGGKMWEKVHDSQKGWYVVRKEGDKELERHFVGNYCDVSVEATSEDTADICIYYLNQGLTFEELIILEPWIKS